LDLFAHETERDPHEEIVRLEEHIEKLDAKIKSCRKFIVATMAAAVAAFLGGIVVWGLAMKELIAAEADQASADRNDHPRVIPWEGWKLV
jgi:hypothetical protein